MAYQMTREEAMEYNTEWSSGRRRIAVNGTGDPNDIIADTFEFCRMVEDKWMERTGLTYKELEQQVHELLGDQDGDPEFIRWISGRKDSISAEFIPRYS